jgi:YLP motif-containing protein 1
VKTQNNQSRRPITRQREELPPVFLLSAAARRTPFSAGKLLEHSGSSRPPFRPFCPAKTLDRGALPDQLGLRMDHPWRFPAGGDICPGCSARHSPFCPPPPLPPHPFPCDLQPSPPPPPQYPPPFHPPPPSPSPPPYQAPFQPPQPMWGPPGPGPHPYELPGREGPHKRMRLGEASPFDPYDAAPPPPPPQPGRPSMEGERLLGLVREHGNYRLPASPLQWHGQPYPSDGFSYGGGRRYHPPYGQGSDFANFDHAGRLPPPALMHDRYNAFDPGFPPGRGPQESYFDGDQRNHQFYPEALPVAPPLPPLPRYVDTDKPCDSCGWHPEARAMSLPPEPPFPSDPDYRAIPPRLTANLSLFPVLSSSPATTALPPSAQTLHQAHPMTNANCYDGHTNNEVSLVPSIYLLQIILGGLFFHQKH